MQSYSSVPSNAMVDIPSSIPSGMLYRIKQIQGCNREQVKMVPVSGQGEVFGGQKIIVQLPPNSLVDLSTFEMIFDFEAQHGGNTAGTNNNKLVQARFMPRNTSSLINALDVKINGSSKQRIDQYNYIYNILHDFNNSDDALRKNKIGQNADPTSKSWNYRGQTKPRRCFPVGIVDLPQTYGDASTYAIRQWLGLIGGNGSTSIIHTGMLGTVELELSLESGGVLMQGIRPNVAAYTNGTAFGGGFTLDLTQNPYNETAQTAYNTLGLIASQGNNYKLSNISFNITKYSMPASFYDALASSLRSGSTYQIYFPDYSIFQGNPTGGLNKSGTTRFTIATKSLDMVIGTFQVANRDVIQEPIFATKTNYIIGAATDTEEGGSGNVYNDIVDAQFPLLLNNSRFFVRDGEFITSCRYLIGGTPLNSENMVEMYDGVLRAFNNSQQDTLGGIHKGCTSLKHFQTQYFSHILKLNANTDSDVYTVSGVNTNENAIDIAWEVTSSTTNVDRYDARLTPANGSSVPILIACHSSHIDISANRNIVSYN